MTFDDFSWSVGFLEGEGSFGKQRHPIIQVMNTDPEPLRRLQHALGGRVNGPYTGRYKSTLSVTPNPKDRWLWCHNYKGETELLMLRLRPFLSERRQAAIDKALT